jgi:hypothetical protein
LETETIKMYLQNYETEHIPIDTYPIPTSYYDDLEQMLDRLFNNNTISEARVFRNLLDNQYELENHFGFKYLNCNQNDKIIDEISILKRRY